MPSMVFALCQRSGRAVKSYGVRGEWRDCLPANSPRSRRTERIFVLFSSVTPWSLEAFFLFVPRQERTKRYAAMAVARLFFRSQFGEGLLNGRKEEQWIVAEAVCAARRVEDETFGGTAKGPDCVPVAGGGQQANEPGGAFFRGDTS